MSLFRSFSFGFIFLCAFFLQSCSSSSNGSLESFPYSKPSYYFRLSETVTLEVFYEAEAEPFVGTTGGGLN